MPEATPGVMTNYKEIPASEIEHTQLCSSNDSDGRTISKDNPQISSKPYISTASRKFREIDILRNFMKLQNSLGYSKI